MSSLNLPDREKKLIRDGIEKRLKNESPEAYEGMETEVVEVLKGEELLLERLEGQACELYTASKVADKQDYYTIQDIDEIRNELVDIWEVLDRLQHHCPHEYGDLDLHTQPELLPHASSQSSIVATEKLAFALYQAAQSFAGKQTVAKIYRLVHTIWHQLDMDFDTLYQFKKEKRDRDGGHKKLVLYTKGT